MADSAHPQRSREAFFGRRKGQKLTARQAGLVEKLLPRLALDLDAPPPPDLARLFGGGGAGAVRLEIGFGGGEHLLAEAARFPGTGFIGVEPFVNGMAKLLAALDEGGPENIRLYADDATRLLDWLAPASLSGIDLFYPDPWPKKRHWKRRFVNRTNLDRFARVLKPGASFRFASDIDTYVEWTLEYCRDHPAFELRNAADVGTPFEGWPGTRYEAKAIREGRRPAYLAFERI